MFLIMREERKVWILIDENRLRKLALCGRLGCFAKHWRLALGIERM